jgi:hypothetical protein
MHSRSNPSPRGIDLDVDPECPPSSPVSASAPDGDFMNSAKNAYLGALSSAPMLLPLVTKDKREIPAVYFRKIRLPKDADPLTIQAVLRNGMLTVTMHAHDTIRDLSSMVRGQ